MFPNLTTHCKTILKYSAVYAAVTHCTFEYLGDFVVCNGPSMEPTLQTKNILLTERISSGLLKKKPQRGEIIIAVSPTNPKQHICKRIVGVPGDKIITTNILNNLDHDNVEDVAENPKVVEKEKPEFYEEYVPKGHVWIEGDNSENSSDSRYYGPIPVGLIRSRVVCRLWPIDDIKMLL